jgi:ribosomal protein S18 acetylase RimI-like enzyme
MPEFPDSQRLLAAMDATWSPAERLALGDWVIRRGLGGGQRVSSVWAKGDPGLPIEAAIDRAVEVQRAWGEPPLIQVALDAAELDARLARRGWTQHDSSVLMAGETAGLAAQETGDLMVVHVSAPLAVLDELWETDGVNAARRAVMARSASPKTALLMRQDDRPAAAAVVAIDGCVAMVHALVVGERFRRRGVGRATIAAAARWAGTRGAAYLGLAVTARNHAAVALYRGMGFTEQGVYHYREGH